MTVWELAGLVGLYNLMTFGNGPIMVPLLRGSLVERRRVLTTEQLLYAFTVARVTPGQANTYVAAIGYMLFGLGGAALCALALIVPGYLVVPLLRLHARIRDVPAVQGFMRGLVATSVGLIFAASVEMARASLASGAAWAVFGVAVILAAVLRWNTVLVLAVASLLGFVLVRLG
jgi:chromate transporter